jgi:hypothetical protein
MNKLITSIAASFMLASVVLADTGTSNRQSCCQDDDSWSIERGFAAVGDVLIVRPIGTAATIASFGVFAVASPFAAMADATDEVFNTLVKEPADYTFDREIGVYNK